MKKLKTNTHKKSLLLIAVLLIISAFLNSCGKPKADTDLEKEAADTTELESAKTEPETIKPEPVVKPKITETPRVTQSPDVIEVPQTTETDSSRTESPDTDYTSPNPNYDSNESAPPEEENSNVEETNSFDGYDADSFREYLYNMSPRNYTTEIFDKMDELYPPLEDTPDWWVASDYFDYYDLPYPDNAM